jgi:hypothetical protein
MATSLTSELNGFDGNYWKSPHVEWEWHNLSTKGDIPSPRFGAKICVLDNLLWLVGGSSIDRYRCADLFRYNFETQTWENMTAKLTPPFLVTESVGMICSYCNRLFVFMKFRTCHIIDIQTLKCETLTYPRSAVAQHTHFQAMTHSATTAYLFPGNNVNAEFRSFLTFDFETKVFQWQETYPAVIDPSIVAEFQTLVEIRRDKETEFFPPPRSSTAVTYFNGKLYLYSGFVLYKCYENDLWMLDLHTKKWQLLVTKGHGRRRAGHMMVVMNWGGPHLVVVSGYDGRYIKDIYAISLEDLVWRNCQIPITQTVTTPGVTVFDNKLIFFGGYSDKYYNTLSVLLVKAKTLVNRCIDVILKHKWRFPNLGEDLPQELYEKVCRLQV